MLTTGEAADVHGSGQPATSNSSWRWCYECEAPESRRAVIYCDDCRHFLCEWCNRALHTFNTTRSHKRMGIDEYLMMDRASGSLSPTEEEIKGDDKNKFCFFSPYDNHIHLQPRLASLVEDPHAQPSLVSFIGPTGVGKSFLLRLLISLDGEKDAGNIPLAGAPNDADSTSGDLHMYASRHEEYPLLYVDSEGRGGSKEPRAIKKMLDAVHSWFPSSGNHDKKEQADAFRSRRFNHVQVSYPRMLYIFSDVLCFVFTGDWREHESIMKPLLEWGKTAADGAANQHLPQLILIFNKTGADAVRAEFDDFGKTYQNWVKADKNSDTTLRRYYSNPLVIRIPHMDINRPAVLNRVKMLRQKILQSTNSIRKSRKELNQLFTRRELHVCMQLAADTFSVNPDGPFDIYKASMARRPNSGGLAGYIIQFHMAVCDENEMSEKCKTSGESFRISLRVLQKRIQWSLLLWIDRMKLNVPLGAKLPKDLKATLQLAQTTIDGQMPCGAVQYLGGKTYHCASLQKTHGDQHCSGKERWDGEFIPCPEMQDAPENCKLVNLGEGALEKCKLEVQKIRKELSEVRRKEHDEYPWLKSVTFYQVCGSCMVDVPTEVLSCGHIICSSCAKEEAKICEAKEEQEMQDTRKEAEISSPKVTVNLTCPICLDFAKWYSKDMPPLAGYRILSLDGGGVRGIVELLSLQKIMSYFPDMHIEDLFDIIVGTSIGGIIALALTVHALDKKPKRLPEVIELFKEFCANIFSKKMLRFGAENKQFLRAMQILRIYDTKYKNKALLELLQKHLGDELILRSCVGGPHVIVTSCDPYENFAAAWFTSYNRLEMLEDESTDKECQLASIDTDNSQRPSSKPLGRVSNNHEFSATDVAAATSAAPTYFPYYKAGGRDWVDGGFQYNCPASLAIREAQTLWRGRKASALISLGCGQMEEQDKKERSQSLITTIDKIVHVVTNAQKQYNEAVEYLKGTQPDSTNCSSRLSPPIQKCELDCVEKIPFLEKETRKYLDSTAGCAYVEEAANLLFATLFYLHVETNQETQKPNLNTLCIRSRSPVPRNLKDALMDASLSELPPFSVTIEPEATAEFFWRECTWHQNVMNLPFRLSNFSLAVHMSQFKVTVQLHMCLPTCSKKLSLPISGMPCTLG